MGGGTQALVAVRHFVIPLVFAVTCTRFNIRSTKWRGSCNRIAGRLRMKKLFVPFMFAVLMGLPVKMHGQIPSKPPPSSKEQAGEQAVTLTGCLTRGSAARAYVINDQISGERIAFAGPPQLETHVGRTVQLT